MIRVIVISIHIMEAIVLTPPRTWTSSHTRTASHSIRTLSKHNHCTSLSAFFIISRWLIPTHKPSSCHHPTYTTPVGCTIYILVILYDYALIICYSQQEKYQIRDLAFEVQRLDSSLCHQQNTHNKHRQLMCLPSALPTPLWCLYKYSIHYTEQGISLN